MTPQKEQYFEKMIRSHELLLFKICRIYARNDQDRKDLMQEILIQLWKSWDSFRGDSKLSTWLYRVALHTAISGLRKKKDFISSTEPDALPHQEADAYDPVKDENLAAMYDAIEKLNQVDRAVIFLYLENKSYEEMEEILGIRQGNLRVKINRIKERLRLIIHQKS